MNPARISMTKNPRLLISLFSLFVLMTALGCGTGYQKVDGEWCYVSWDEGNGRTVSELNADSGSFEILANSEYAKDKNRVYHRSRRLEADPATLEILAGNYIKDKDRVFYRQVEITGADPKSFQILEAPYSRDQESVFCGTVPMNVDSVDDFKVIRASEGMFTSILSNHAFQSKYGKEFPNSEIERAIVPGSYSRARSGSQFFEGPSRVAPQEIDWDDEN